MGTHPEFGASTEVVLNMFSENRYSVEQRTPNPVAGDVSLMKRTIY